MPAITMASIECAPGKRASGIVPAVNRVDGTTLGIPVLIVNGKGDGPVLLVDGGIHGDEQEGTLAIAAFAAELDPEKLNGVFLGVPVMNVGAFEAMSRGNPRDTHTYDMNRMYPGRPKGYLTDRIAHVHAREIGQLADLEITIHSGGNICYLGETIFTASGDEASFELAQAMGEDWQIVLDTPHPVGSPMAAMVDRGKTAITVELGGSAGLMPDMLQRNVHRLVKAMRNISRHCGMIEGDASYASQIWRGKQSVVMASKSGILRPNPALVETKLTRAITEGEPLLTIDDLFGESLEELSAPCNGTLFGFRTYPSTTAGDWCLFCGDAELQAVAAPGT